MCVCMCFQVPPLPELKVVLTDGPGTVALEKAFQVTCSITNTRWVGLAGLGGRRVLGADEIILVLLVVARLGNEPP